MTTENKKITSSKLNNVVIGLLVGFDKQQQPLVVFPNNLQENAIAARTTAHLDSDDIGKEVALLFEQGDPQYPLVIGLLQKPEPIPLALPTESPTEVVMDEEHLVLNAKQSITLQCGKASITLTKSGKILLRGTYLLSRSSGVNRIKGGSVQIN